MGKTARHHHHHELTNSVDQTAPAKNVGDSPQEIQREALSSSTSSLFISTSSSVVSNCHTSKGAGVAATATATAAAAALSLAEGKGPCQQSERRRPKSNRRKNPTEIFSCHIPLYMVDEVITEVQKVAEGEQSEPQLFDPTFHVTAHHPPRLLQRELTHVFPFLSQAFVSDLVIFSTVQHAPLDLTALGPEVDEEKDRLLERFVKWSQSLSRKLDELCPGHWTVYIDPCSGLPIGKKADRQRMVEEKEEDEDEEGMEAKETKSPGRLTDNLSGEESEWVALSTKVWAEVDSFQVGSIRQVLIWMFFFFFVLSFLFLYQSFQSLPVSSFLSIAAPALLRYR